MFPSGPTSYSFLNREPDEKGERSYSIYALLLKSRIVYIRGAIGPDVADSIIAQLLYLEQEDNETDIKIYINSPGGIVYYGLAIYDTMQLIKPDVSTVCIGVAASMGAILLAAGTKGKRYALPNSRILIHQPLGEIPYGQASDIAIQAQEVLYTKQQVYTILSEHTGQSVEKIATDCDRDFYMSPAQALEYGIIDQVLSKAARTSR
jgi:ATP-dependent Clp protease protease subunit